MGNMWGRKWGMENNYSKEQFFIDANRLLRENKVKPNKTKEKRLSLKVPPKVLRKVALGDDSFSQMAQSVLRNLRNVQKSKGIIKDSILNSNEGIEVNTKMKTLAKIAENMTWRFGRCGPNVLKVVWEYFIKIGRKDIAKQLPKSGRHWKNIGKILEREPFRKFFCKIPLNDPKKSAPSWILIYKEWAWKKYVYKDGKRVLNERYLYGHSEIATNGEFMHAYKPQKHPWWSLWKRSISEQWFTKYVYYPRDIA